MSDGRSGYGVPANGGKIKHLEVIQLFIALKGLVGLDCRSAICEIDYHSHINKATQSGGRVAFLCTKVTLRWYGHPVSTQLDCGSLMTFDRVVIP